MLKKTSSTATKQVAVNSLNGRSRHCLFILSLVLACTIFGQAQTVTSSPSPTPTPSSTPAPTGNDDDSADDVYTIPYRISYGITATDRNYGNPGGLSRQRGTLTFRASFFEDQLELRLANQNFVVGRDATGERAVNFGNTGAGIFYAPTRLQERTTLPENTSLEDTKFYPSVSFDYEATLPTGSRRRGLNVGRVDHDVTLILEKKIGEKILIKGTRNIVRATAIEADFGVSFSANEGGGYAKTGNAIFILSHVLGNVKESKYIYTGEIDFLNLARKQRTLIRAVNSLSIKIDESGTRLGLGLITGISRGTPRVGVNVSIRFKGALKIKK